MSELTNNWRQLSNRRWKLFASASTMALATSFSLQTAVAADMFLASSDQPSLWLEFGGDYERIDSQLDQWTPVEFGALAGSGEFIRKEPSGSFGIEGKATYRIDNSDWKISISARYGRTQRKQSFHTQTGYNFTGQKNVGYGATSRHLENHMIVDFDVGKDVGLGLFGTGTDANLAVGVRIAQFNTTGDDMVSSAPYETARHQLLIFHTAHLERRTSAWGPSLSLEGSIPLVSGSDDRLSVDWGALGAFLFGRQKVSNQFKSHEFYRYGTATGAINFPSDNIDRRKNVLIPNLEGSAALSFSLPAAKITIGYRADAYWNATDGGIEVHSSKKQFFYGPFARISIGLGG